MIKDLKLEILICFDSVIAKHWTPLHRIPHVFPIPSLNWEIFVALELLGVGLKNILWASEPEEQCVKIQPRLSS